MRISDWSSDVCSSDLRLQPDARPDRAAEGRPAPGAGGARRAPGERAGGARRGRAGEPHEGRIRRHPLARAAHAAHPDPGLGLERKSAVWGTSVSVRVDLGGRRIIKKKKETTRK